MKRLIKIISIPVLLMLFGCSGGGGAAGNATFSMSLSATSVVAGGSVSSTAQLTSTTTQPVNNIDVTYTSNRTDLIHFATNTATNSGGSSITVKTNSSGSAYVVLNIDNSVAIPAEGVSVSITATSSGMSSTKQLTVTAVSGGTGTVGGTKVQLSLDKASIQDNGGQAVATATVTDSAGNILSGQTVTFSISPTTGPATILPINGGVTDSSGRAFATITGTTTGTTQNIFIYATTSNISTAQPLAVVPSSSTTPSSIPKNIALSFGKTSLQPTEQTILTATVTDGSSLPVANQAVSFSLQPSGVHATISPINSGLTDSAGKAYAVVSATTATATENVVVYAITGVSPNTVTGSSIIQVLPPGSTSTTLPAANISMIPDKTSIQPNGQALITTTITDAASAVVSGAVVTFSVVSGPITLVTPASATTGGDGKVLAVVQANATTNPTYALIKATTANGATQTISMVIAPTGKPQLTLSIAKQTIEATDQEVLATVQVLDSDGNPVNGQTVTFSKISGPFTVDSTLVTVTTGSDGKATTKLTPTATAFASNMLLSMQLSYQGTTYSLVATALVNPAVKLSVTLDSATVDTVGQIIATAVATTASGTPLPGQVVTFSITGPGTIVGQSSTSAADGTSKAVITHDATSNIGNIIVEASITYGGTTYRAYATAVPKTIIMKLELFVQSDFGPSYNTTSLIGSSLTDYPTTMVDGLTPGLPIKAKFTYPDGTPVPNQTITFTALDPGLFWNTSGGAQNGSSVVATTTTSGEAYVVAVPGNFNASGFIHIEASTVINGVTYKQVMPIAVQARQLQKTFTLDNVALVISPNSFTNVNGTYNLKDSNNAPIVGQNVTFSIISGPATVTAPATAATDGSGNATVFIKAGPNVTARETVYVNAAVTINGVTHNTVSSFTVDPSIKLSLITDVTVVNKVGTSGGQVIATATLTDSGNVAISGQNVTFVILGTSPATITSAATTATSTSGEAKATIQTTAVNSTQNVLVQATTSYAGVTYTQVTAFQVTTGIGSLVVTAPATTSSSAKAPASVVWLTSIPVTLMDANGNPRTNVPVTLSVSSSLGGAGTYRVVDPATNGLVAAATVNTDSKGVAMFEIQTPVLSVGTVGDFDTTQVVWQARTNDATPVIGYAASTYNLTGS